MNRSSRRGVYPGSFNPPTTAHLAIATAARDHHRLDLVVLTVSTVALAKESVSIPSWRHRIDVLHEVVADVSWLEVETTEKQLIADIAVGYDVVIMGADKWEQIQDPVFYGNSDAARDQAIASLPTIAVAPRGGRAPDHDRLLALDGFERVSSTAARAGDRAVMLPAAMEFDQRTGAWTDPDAYRAWLGGDATPP